MNYVSMQNNFFYQMTPGMYQPNMMVPNMNTMGNMSHMYVNPMQQMGYGGMGGITPQFMGLEGLNNMTGGNSNYPQFMQNSQEKEDNVDN